MKKNSKVLLLVILLASLPGAKVQAKTCDAKLLSITSRFDPTENVIKSRIEMLSNQPFDWMRQGVDPQNWAKCSSYWKQTFLVESGAETPLPNPPAPGSQYKGVLFEDLAFDVAKIDVLDLKNLLDISVTSTDDFFNVHYDLHSSLSNSILGCTSDGGTEVDGGDITIEPANEGSWKWRFIGEKTSRFKVLSWLVPQRLLNSLAAEGLKKAGTQFSRDLVCCEF